MKPILIGSRALAYHRKDFVLSPSSDYDVISQAPLEGTEWHDPDKLGNALIESYITDQTVDFNGTKLYIPSLKALALIKRSHLHRPLSFGKHITHYHKHGLHPQLNELDLFDKTFLKQRTLLTKRDYPLINPPLNRSKESFFDDGIYRRYDHDYLHELVAYYDRPLYTQLQEPDDEIKCHKYLWDNLSQKDKLLCVAEETYVTALERFILVPRPIPYKLGYIKSLEKVCTTMTSGYFRDFAIDNYPQLFDLFDQQKLTSITNYLGEHNDI